MSFYPGEAERIEFAELVLIAHIQPSEIAHMSDQQKWDVLEIAGALNALKNGKMPGEK